jgi:hypothetical protein
MSTGQDAARIAELQKENDTLRGLLGSSSKPCVYCNLPAAEQIKCAHGFPGCMRADDQMLGKYFFDGYRAMELEAEMTAIHHLHPIDEYHEDKGCVLWWKLPINEPPYVGTESDDDWPGYHTHWSIIPRVWEYNKDAIEPVPEPEAP